MSPKKLRCEFNEPERYELREKPAYSFELNRREFIHMLGAGLVISTAPVGVIGELPKSGSANLITERLHLSTDGMVTVLTSKVEVGQGSRTQLTQAAAEELGVTSDDIQLVMADSAIVPDDGGTAGSRTTPSTVPSVRKACALLRQLLLRAAAGKFDLPIENLHVLNGKVQGLGGNRTFTYADLAASKDLQQVQNGLPETVGLRSVDQWTVLGRSLQRVDGRAILTGAHRYPSDIVRPGMLYGKVLRPPSFGARLKSMNPDSVHAIPGIVFVRDGDFVGFAGPDSFSAEQARTQAAREAVWAAAEHSSSDNLYEHLRASRSSERVRRQEHGSVQSAFGDAKLLLRQSYVLAYVQHAPLEPRAAVAEWSKGAVTVWTGTQQPSRVRQELARAFQISQEKVRVIVPDTGGAFGGKHTGEVALEAARLAKAAGNPVSVCWTREEEFTWAYFRPAGVMDLAGALDDKGRVSGWEHVNLNSGASSLSSPYDFPNSKTEFLYCDSPLREGSYRALAATANTFARECFMDELAEATGADPLEFRLRHLSNDRLRGVLQAATERFGWPKKGNMPSDRQGTGIGLACGTEKGSYVACCVEVAVSDDRRFRVTRVVEAFECGAIHNPANLQAQVQGSILQGMGAALYEEVRFENGRILNPQFSEYRVPRFLDVPDIETVLLDRQDLPSAGGGETPIIAIAPAIANALYNATGTRIRSMPIRNAEYSAA